METKCKKGMHLILVKSPKEKKICIFKRRTDILKDKRSFVLSAPLSILDNTTRLWPPAPTRPLTTPIMNPCDKCPLYILLESLYCHQCSSVHLCTFLDPTLPRPLTPPSSHRRISGTNSYAEVLDSPQLCIMFGERRNVVVSQRDEVLTYNYSLVGPWNGGVRSGQLGQHPVEALCNGHAVTQQN